MNNDHIFYISKRHNHYSQVPSPTLHFVRAPGIRTGLNGGAALGPGEIKKLIFWKSFLKNVKIVKSCSPWNFTIIGPLVNTAIGKTYFSMDHAHPCTGYIARYSFKFDKTIFKYRNYSGNTVFFVANIAYTHLLHTKFQITWLSTSLQQSIKLEHMAIHACQISHTDNAPFASG